MDGPFIYATDIKIRGNAIIERLYATVLPAPFLSILIDDCIAKGKDYHAGGARYNTNYIQGVGVGTMTDILASIKYNVYDKKYVPRRKLLDVLDRNFEGEEILRRRFLNKTPKLSNRLNYRPEKEPLDIFSVCI